ncbi:MAG: hypothetical protein J5590_06350 [Clostridia bacterium]|nr:hypothetical protein [Clostridia bacterium]
MYFFDFLERDSKPERAASVKKICLRHIFSEAGAKAGTESEAFGRRAVKMRSSFIPFSPPRKKHALACFFQLNPSFETEKICFADEITA